MRLDEQADDPNRAILARNSLTVVCVCIWWPGYFSILPPLVPEQNITGWITWMPCQSPTNGVKALTDIWQMLTSLRPLSQSHWKVSFESRFRKLFFESAAFIQERKLSYVSGPLSKVYRFWKSLTQNRTCSILLKWLSKAINFRKWTVHTGKFSVESHFRKIRSSVKGALEMNCKRSWKLSSCLKCAETTVVCTVGGFCVYVVLKELKLWKLHNNNMKFKEICQRYPWTWVFMEH